MKHLGRIWALALVAYLFVVSTAAAAVVVPQAPLSLNAKQTWALLIGALVPLVTYVLNHVGPWVSEPVKAFVTVLVSAVAGGAYTALATSSFGWNSATLQMILTSVVAALGAHQLLWKPSGVSTVLGGGSNASGHARRRLRWVADDPAPPAADPPAKA